MTSLLEDALRQFISQRPTRGSVPRFEFPTYKGGGLRAGVDLDDSAALLDRMEGRE